MEAYGAEGMSEASSLRTHLPLLVARLMQRAGVRNPLDLLLEKDAKETAARAAHVAVRAARVDLTVSSRISRLMFINEETCSSDSSRNSMLESRDGS